MPPASTTTVSDLTTIFYRFCRFLLVHTLPVALALRALGAPPHHVTWQPSAPHETLHRLLPAYKCDDTGRRGVEQRLTPDCSLLCGSPAPSLPPQASRMVLIPAPPAWRP